MSNVSMSAISYTPNIISSQLLQDLNLDQNQQATIEAQLGSGDVVNAPSDNPAAAASIMQLNSGLSRAKQYVTNANDGVGWLSLGTSTLNSVISTLQSAQQAVSALSGEALSSQQAAVTGTTAQLKSTLQQVLALANTTYGGQAIFAGTGNVNQAYDSSGNYVGGGAAPARTVAPGVSVQVSLTGPQVFGSGSTGLLGSSGVLQQLITDVSAGTTTSLQKATTTDLSALSDALQSVTGQAAVMGANYQRMTGFANQATSAQTALQTQISSEDSVNLAQASTQLTQDQQTYQAGLWATSQIEEHSLVNYL
ncbi:MAG TPA: flagellin [Acidimicrobiales bacterium]|jgi:flagellar hook-associated protein 3 FlgL|nr:flagellin [Acidimicrobiales bacterium]